MHLTSDCRQHRGNGEANGENDGEHDGGSARADQGPGRSWCHGESTGDQAQSRQGNKQSNSWLGAVSGGCSWSGEGPGDASEEEVVDTADHAREIRRGRRGNKQALLLLVLRAALRAAKDQAAPSKKEPAKATRGPHHARRSDRRRGRGWECTAGSLGAASGSLRCKDQARRQRRRSRQRRHGVHTTRLGIYTTDVEVGGDVNTQPALLAWCCERRWLLGLVLQAALSLTRGKAMPATQQRISRVRRRGVHPHHGDPTTRK
jgi:hypothetical protein